MYVEDFFCFVWFWVRNSFLEERREGSVGVQIKLLFLRNAAMVPLPLSTCVRGRLAMGKGKNLKETIKKKKVIKYYKNNIFFRIINT